jgi:hypothetical protein
MTPQELIHLAQTNARRQSEKLAGEVAELTKSAEAAKYGSVTDSLAACEAVFRHIEQRLNRPTEPPTKEPPSKEPPT